MNAFPWSGPAEGLLVGEPKPRAPKTYKCPACGHVGPRRPRMPLSRRQREIVEFCHEFEKREHIFPSFSEIQQQFGFRSPATVDEHMKCLVQKGWVIRVGGPYTARPFTTRRSAFEEA